MTTDKTPATLATVKHGGCVQLPDSERARQSMATCPRDGTVVILHWGEDHVSPGWWSAPVSPVQNDDGTWPSDTGGFPWAFIDINDGSAFVNHAVDTEYGPTHWTPYAALSAQPSPGGQGDANSPLTVYADSYHRMAKMGDGRVLCSDVAFDIEHNMSRALAARQPGAQVPHGSEFAVSRTMEDAEAASDGMLPAALVPVADEWYRLCERRFAVDRIRISGKLAEAIVDTVCAAPPAQAVDLKQFRPAVELMEWQERGHANPDFPVGDPKKHAEALRLLALIDSQPVNMTEGAMRAAASRQTASAESNATAEALIAWARQPVGELTDTEIDARLNTLYRAMVASGQHNGGMSGVAWDRAVYRMASSQPAQAVDPADPWRGLYSPELMPKLDGVNLYHAAHPDLPSWPKDEDDERGIGPLITAQGFAMTVVFGEYPDDDGEEVDYCAWLASWTPNAPAGLGWRLVCIQDTEDGPAAFYVRPLALIDSQGAR